MNSENTLKKYINETFGKCADVKYTSNFTADIEMIDGKISLLALNNTITIFIDKREFQTMELVDGKFKLVY